MDIRLWEVGAKRPLHGTSKVNKQTYKQTHRQKNIWTFRLIESIGPEGRCFEKNYRCDRKIEELEKEVIDLKDSVKMLANDLQDIKHLSKQLDEKNHLKQYNITKVNFKLEEKKRQLKYVTNVLIPV